MLCRSYSVHADKQSDSVTLKQESLKQEESKSSVLRLNDDLSSQGNEYRDETNPEDVDKLIKKETTQIDNNDTPDEAINSCDPVENSQTSNEYLKPYSQNDKCDHNPDFAIICSFIEQFGNKIDIELDIQQLETSIEEQISLDDSLIELHVKLLKKIRRYFVRDQWEKALIRFTSEYSYEDAYELERLGYLKTRPSIKLELLRRLMDAQFECDQKFKSSINLCEADEFRIQPVGRDVKGNTYWQKSDQRGNLRVFQEQPLDYKSWRTICRNPEELTALIDELEKSQDEKVKGSPFDEPYNPLPDIFPYLFIKEEEKKEDEDEVKRSVGKKGRSRKGRGRGRGKKSGTLPVVEEVEDDMKEVDLTQDLKMTPPHHIRDVSESLDTSLESQVRSTIETLLSKVVSSFEYLMRPLSRNSPEAPKEVPKPENKKKRATKKERKVEEVLPRRSSSRIQQLQLKKIAEQGEEQKKSSDSGSPKSNDIESKCYSTKGNRRRSESPDSRNGCRKRRRGKTWKRGKGKKKLSWDQDDSDLSSTSSLTESNEDDFEETDFKFEPTNYDDEFACEEEETNMEPVVVKRARTARQSVETADLNTSSILEEDKPCGRCDKSNDPEWILLCDACNDGYHTSCCVPPLMIVPDGDWFCPQCEHKMLIPKLRELLSKVIEILDAEERERLKKQKLRQVKKEPKTEQQKTATDKRQRVFLNEPVAVHVLNEYLGSSSDESIVSTTKSRSRPKKSTKKAFKSSKKDEYRSTNHKYRKTYSRRNISESENSVSESETHSSSSDELVKPKARRARNSVSYRFQEYDELIKSAIRGESYDEESSEKETVPERCIYGKGKDMATIEAIAYQQENGFVEQDANAAVVEGKEIQLPKSKTKKKGRRLNDLDAISESEDASSDESFQASSATELEDEDLTEDEMGDDTETSIDEILGQSKHFRSKKKKRRRSKYSSDEDDDYQPARTRRAASNRVSYKESTDEEADFIDTPKKSRLKLLSDEESEVSWKGSPKSFVEDDVSTSCESTALKISESPVAEEEHQAISNVTGPKDEPNLTTGQNVNQDEVPFKKVKLERQQQSPVPPSNVSINESFDEIAAPLYTKPSNHQAKQIPVQPTSHVTIPHVAAENRNLDVDSPRDPIQELNLYCKESANTSTNMFTSYNQTLTSKNSASPPYLPFYEDDKVRPSSSEVKEKKTKKSRVNSRPTETSTCEPIKKEPAIEKTRISTPSHPSESERISLTRQHTNQPRPIISTPQRFHQPPMQHMSPQVYPPMHPSPLYPRTPFPTKYDQRPGPIPHQLHPYPNAYSSPMPNFDQQSRPGVPQYPNTHMPSGIWNTSHMSGPRPPLPQASYYSTSCPVPNPNFSIHQLLGNPYSTQGLGSQSIIPNLSQPQPSSQHSSLNPLQPAPVASQPPQADNSSKDNRANADKDTIRGMSDVISFIGDT